MFVWIGKDIKIKGKLEQAIKAKKNELRGVEPPQEQVSFSLKKAAIGLDREIERMIRERERVNVWFDVPYDGHSKKLGRGRPRKRILTLLEAWKTGKGIRYFLWMEGVPCP